jgi:hypothetical protein
MPLASTLTAALQRPGEVQTLITLSLPASAGGTMRVATEDVPSKTLGLFRDRVLSIGKVRYEISNRDGAIPVPTVTFELDDTGTAAVPVGPFGRATELADVEFSPVLIERAAVGVPVADWSTRFKGVLTDYERVRPGRYRVNARVDDRWLNQPAPPPQLGAAEWPAAASKPKASAGAGDAVIGRYVPIAYGKTDSAGLGSHGLRRCLYVHTAGPPYRYMHSLGDVAVPSVYADGVKQTTGWTRVVENRGGRYFTLIDFTADQVDKVITVDSDGLPLGSYGTNTSPANQLRHMLESFDRWNGETGVQVTPTRTDGTAFAALEAFVTAHGYEYATLLGGVERAQTMRQVLAAWLKQHHWVAFWTRQGTLAVQPWSWVPPATLEPTSPTSIEGIQALGDMALKRDTSGIVRAVACRHLLGPDGERMAGLKVVDPAEPTAAAEELVADFAGRIV